MITVETYDINRHNNLLKLQYSYRVVLSGKFCGSSIFAKRAHTTLLFWDTRHHRRAPRTCYL